ncbi:MAG: SurA N-terminal domain-containing protein [Nitrospirota bacterium]
MLKIMRQHAKYFYVLFFIVILTFIFWGVGTVDKDSDRNIIAEVGEYKITSEEYWRAYDRVFRLYSDIYKEKFDNEMQNRLKLKENVLDSLIDNRVLLIASKENGMTVTDEELNEVITSDPAFMRNGGFDNDIYYNTLRLSRITPEIYEAQKKQELSIMKITRLIELSANIPENELSGISADEQTLKAIKESMINEAKDKAVRAYIDGLKKQIDIKIYKDRIS